MQQECYGGVSFDIMWQALSGTGENRAPEGGEISSFLCLIINCLYHAHLMDGGSLGFSPAQDNVGHSLKIFQRSVRSLKELAVANLAA